MFAANFLRVETLEELFPLHRASRSPLRESWTSVSKPLYNGHPAPVTTKAQRNALVAMIILVKASWFDSQLPQKRTCTSDKPRPQSSATGLSHCLEQQQRGEARRLRLLAAEPRRRIREPNRWLGGETGGETPMFFFLAWMDGFGKWGFA